MTRGAEHKVGQPEGTAPRERVFALVGGATLWALFWNLAHLTLAGRTLVPFNEQPFVHTTTMLALKGIEDAGINGHACRRHQGYHASHQGGTSK